MKKKRISWETVAALAIVVVGVVTALVFTPEATVDRLADLPWESWLGLGGAGVGVGLLAAGRRLLRDEGS
jgi:hypothetical protein